MTASTIEAHTRVIGSIDAEGDLVVLGRVEGSVRAKGRLTLGPCAVVTGELEAHDVRIACTLERAVRAAGVIHLLSTAEVRGDLDASRVVIDDGALFEGQVRLLRGQAIARVEAAAGTPSAPPASTPGASTPGASTPAASTPAARLVPELPAVGRRVVQRRQA